MMKSKLVVLAVGLAFGGSALAGLAYTPVAPAGKPSPKLAGLAVQCVPIKGDKPGVQHAGKNAVTLLCKPQYLHMRGIEASKANLKLLFAGKGYDAALKVYRLKYGAIGTGKILKATESVASPQSGTKVGG